MPANVRQGNTIGAAELRAALQHTVLGDSVHHLAETHSTNDLALAAAQSGQKHGVWVADAQTAGRGRGGHAWLSAPGDGLYVSALFSPCLPATAFDLSLAAGLAAWDAVRDVTGILADIRWPNDLMTRDARCSRKLGGVLVEAAVTTPAGQAQAMLRYAVLSRLGEASTWLHGKRVVVPEEGGYTGVTAGLDARGFLLVDSDEGVRRTVRSGGVREL